LNAWQRLDRELDAWRDSGRKATLWCRDDDACRDTPALRRLLGAAGVNDVPVALAAIPATLEPSLREAVAASVVATVVQHGYAHRNHAPPGARNWELGADRAVTAVIGELALGTQILARAFGERFAAVLVPPWNRIHAGVTAALPAAGFRGLSAFGPRPAASPAPGLVQCNSHVDLIAWRRQRAFIGVDTALDRLTAHLAARREGSVDATEPTGILTHHLDMSEDAWQFLATVVGRLSAHAATAWLDVTAIFAAGEPATRLISGRSA
jgi:hypothetical protein